VGKKTKANDAKERCGESERASKAGSQPGVAPDRALTPRSQPLVLAVGLISVRVMSHNDFINHLFQDTRSMRRISAAPLRPPTSGDCHSTRRLMPLFLEQSAPSQGVRHDARE
jgi:hypothetical protein